MALAGMSSKEKTIVAVLGAIIVVALVGVGVLAARLISGDSESDSPAIVVVSPTSSTQTMATGAPGLGAGAGEATAVGPPALEAPQDGPPPSASQQPVPIAQAQSVGPLAPVMIANQVLHGGHRYQIEIRAGDGSQRAISGSWSQAATSQSGQAVAPQIEFFAGVTPHRITVDPPVADPSMWGCSVSASFQEAAGQSTNLVIIIWDVTGVE